MGRPPLEEQVIRETTIQLAETAKERILSQRLNNVTIRKIAAKSGLNSAVIYKHFQDPDELLRFACADFFAPTAMTSPGGRSVG